MRLDGFDVIYDYTENFTVVSVDCLDDLFQVRIGCGIVLDNQNHSVRLLHQRQRVDYDTDRRSIEDDIIEFLFKLERSSDGLGGIAP